MNAAEKDTNSIDIEWDEISADIDDNLYREDLDGISLNDGISEYLLSPAPIRGFHCR